MKRPRLRAIIAAIIALPVILASLLLVGAIDQLFSMNNEIKHMQAKLDSLRTVTEVLAVEQITSAKWLAENIDNSTKLITSALSYLNEEGVYYGPRVFNNAMVVDIVDGQVICPEGLQSDFPVLTSETVVTLANKETDNSLSTIEIKRADGSTDAVIVSAGKILDNTYYVEWFSTELTGAYIEAHSRLQEVLDAAASAFGGKLVLLGRTMDQEINVIVAPSDSSDAEGEKKEQVDWKEALSELEKSGGLSVVEVNGTTYYTAVSESSDGSFLLVFLLEKGNILSTGLLKIAVAGVIMLFITVLLIFYVTSIKLYVKKNPLTEHKTAKYRPGSVRKKVLLAGAIGLVILIAVSCLVQILSNLQTETQIGQERLTALTKSLKEGSTSISSKAVTAEEEWYVYNGERLAELISQYPELSDRTVLQQMCNAINLKYIMLFDPEGKEYSCNLDYSGFTLGVGQGENSEDFLRLQQGIESIVHPAGKDDLTGIEAQMIGVSFPTVSSNQYHSVLMMALPPDQTKRTQEGDNDKNQLAYLANITEGGNLYFVAESETGKIIQSNDESLDETLVSFYGLNEKSLKGGFMGFATIKGQKYYVMNQQEEEVLYYYATPMSYIYEGLFIFCLSVGGSYLILFIILYLILLPGYSKKRYNGYLMAAAAEAAESDPDEEDEEEDVPEKQYETGETARGLRRRLSKIRMADQLPEGKTRLLFRIMFLIVILMIGVYIVLNLNQLRYNNSSLLSFILFGDWMKGANLFALTAILFLGLGVYLATAIVKWFLSLLAEVLGSRAETICRLIHSFVHYVAVLFFLYFALEYLGFKPSTILAGLGIVGFAVSFGAKDMVADIFAGISIVFEGAFQVGETVKIGNFKGIVESIGIRMTTLIATDNSLKIINNKDVKDVVNLSRLSSWVTVSFKVSSTQSVFRIRTILERELPLIGERNKYIISEPKFLGVRETDGAKCTFLVAAECAERHFGKVKTYLNEEILELMIRENIER